MARVVLLTGGNSGDVKRTLQAAQQLVNAKVGAVLRCSHRYETKPWGFDADGVFSNQALEVSTDLLPLEVLDAVQAIERELGRNRAAEAVEKARHGRELYLAADRYRHPLLRRRGDRQRTPYRAASAHGRTGVRTRAALRDHAASAAIAVVDSNLHRELFCRLKRRLRTR